jgi:uncharacterized protein HemX
MAEIPAVAASELPVKRRRRWPWGLLLLVLLLIGAAAGGAWFVEQRLGAQVRAAQAALTAAQQSSATLTDQRLQSIDALNQRLSELEGKLDASAARDEQLTRDLAALGARTDSAIAAIGQAEAERPDAATLKLDDIENLLAIARQRSALGNDPAGTRTALELARQQLAALADLRQQGTIEAIDVALSTLGQSATVDRAALIADLDLALEQVDSLALPGALPLPAAAPAAASIGAALARYFRVERVGANEATRDLSEAELEGELKALLRLIRLAALSGDTSSFRAGVGGLSPVLNEFADGPERRALAAQIDRWRTLKLNQVPLDLAPLLERFRATRRLD